MQRIYFLIIHQKVDYASKPDRNAFTESNSSNLLNLQHHVTTRKNETRLGILTEGLAWPARDDLKHVPSKVRAKRTKCQPKVTAPDSFTVQVPYGGITKSISTILFYLFKG